ncbi:DUF4865 family protein [Geodermatophilus sp. SYSU D00815]
MQYEITLPADYDMTIIRRRVATRGSATDAFPGLGVKAYAIRERGVLGSPVNEYAPFYLWADPAGMNEFLFGPPFAGLAADFGRPVVRHWTGVAFRPGPAWKDTPIAATRTTSSLPAEVPVADVVDAALADLDAGQETGGLHSCALVVDPATWEIVHFRLWAEEPADRWGQRYQALHVSAPHLHALPGVAR